MCVCTIIFDAKWWWWFSGNENFVGSNNLNLLLPVGQFGSRKRGANYPASPRYLSTKLNPLTRILFPQLDDPLLIYLQVDNLISEPKYFVKIIPFVLVNGMEGIACCETA